MIKRLTMIFAVVATSIFAVDFAMATPKKDKTEQASVNGPEITLREKAFDFGYIKEEGGPVRHEFEFINTGDQPLVIISATASCGCTRPKYPTEPIRPGKKGKITVTYLPQGRPGEFDKAVKVKTNCKKSKKFTLKISGTVVPKND